LVILGTLLLFARRTENLLYPQFWAEDGTLYFREFFNEGGSLSLLFRRDDGYLNIFPRLVTAFSLLFPMRSAPLIFNLSAFLVQALPLLYLAGNRSSTFLPSFPLKAVVSLLYVCIPNSSETYVNVANSSWYLLIIALLVVVCAPPRSAVVRLAELLMLTLCALTGPVILFLLPILLYRLVFEFRGEEAKWGGITALLVGSGIAVQVWSIIGSTRLGESPRAFESFSHLLSATALNTIDKTLLGNSVVEHGAWLQAPATATAFLLLLWLAVMTVRSRCLPLIALLLFATATVTTSIVFPIHSMEYLLASSMGSRYFLFAALWVVLTLLLLSLRRGGSRYPARALLALTLIVGIPTDFLHYPLPDTGYRRQVEAFEGLPGGRAYSFQINPPLHLPMTLRTRGGDKGLDLLAGMARSPRKPQYSLDAIRQFRNGVRGMLRISGEVKEATVRGRGAVVIMAGSTPYLASLSHRPGSTLFFRHLPIEEIAGAITLDILVVDFEKREYASF
jgi:hypothetical protein